MVEVSASPSPARAPSEFLWARLRDLKAGLMGEHDDMPPAWFLALGDSIDHVCVGH